MTTPAGGESLSRVGRASGGPAAGDKPESLAALSVSGAGAAGSGSGSEERRDGRRAGESSRDPTSSERRDSDAGLGGDESSRSVSGPGVRAAPAACRSGGAGPPSQCAHCAAGLAVPAAGPGCPGRSRPAAATDAGPVPLPARPGPTVLLRESGALRALRAPHEESTMTRRSESPGGGAMSWHSTLVRNTMPAARKRRGRSIRRRPVGRRQSRRSRRTRSAADREP